jgi:alpha-galactosidase
MIPRAKIVILGAGSMSFGLSMFRDIFLSKQLAGSTLTLVTRHADTAARAAGLAHFFNKTSEAGLTIEHTTDRRAALDGAGFVVNSTSIDRNRLWKLDFEVPRRYGIRQTLGENGGPGGLFFTLRTLPIIFDFIRDMEEICPRALFINFSNPESRIIMALGKYAKIRNVGLCHGIYGSRDQIAKIINIPADQVEVRGAGLNHFQCLCHIFHRDTGEDLYPRLCAAEKDYDPSDSPLTRQLFRAFGYWLTCGDGHLGEYLPYGWEAGEGGYDFAGDERWRQQFAKIVDDVLAGSAPSPDYWLKPSGERGVDLIAAVLHNQKRFLESGIVYNQGTIPNLPSELAVEVPVLVDGIGVHPVSIGPLPAAVAKLISIQANVQQLAVEAAVHASKELALQALLIDPVINSSTAAVKLLDELWEVNLPYIRACV